MIVIYLCQNMCLGGCIWFEVALLIELPGIKLAWPVRVKFLWRIQDWGVGFGVWGSGG